VPTPLADGVREAKAAKTAKAESKAAVKAESAARIRAAAAVAEAAANVDEKKAALATAGLYKLNESS
jgi:hypothetical protein